MSLYGGIKFTAEELRAQAASESSAAQERAATSASSSSATYKPVASGSGTFSSAAALDRVRVGPTSAALSFAPRINKPKVAAPRASTSYHAQPIPASQTLATSSGASGIVRSAEPVLLDQTEAKKGDEVILGKDGRPLAKAPAMLLADRRDWKNKGEEAKKRRKKKKRKAPLMHAFDPDEPYDPNRPNDLGEYQEYRQRLRDERRAKYIENKRRKAAGESSEGSSVYSESDEDVAPRRDAPKLWAPPKEYSAPVASATPPASIPPPAPPPATGEDAYARRLAMSQGVSGDDAYAKRAALSQQTLSGDDAYSRRAAMGRQSIPSPGQPHSPPGPPLAPPPPPTDDSAPPPPPEIQPPPPSGSLFRPPPPNDTFAPAPPSVPHPPFPPTSFRPLPSLPNFVPPPAHIAAAAPSPLAQAGTPEISHQPPAPVRPFVPPPPSLMAAAPGINSVTVRPPPPMPKFPPSFAPQAVPEFVQPLPEDPSESADPEFVAKLEERKKALAAIAAKFETLPGLKPKQPSVPFEDIEGESFAEKMMRKWGHKEGQGLGSKQEGITAALAVEHVAAPPKNPAQMSKRQLAKQKMAAANAKTNAKNNKWIQHASTRGKIINAGEEARQKEDKEKYGEASRIICLVGVVTDLDEVDEDLSEEIGEECSKYGFVERVVLHMVEPPPENPAEALRVFVVFSGMAGAWRSLKELDGRFFGGRKIRATYFDETKFDAGERDGSAI